MEQNQPQSQTDATKATGSPSAHKYIYAVIKGPSGRNFDFAGLDDKPVTTIGQGDIVYVTSDIGLDEIRPERKYLMRHREVLSKLVEQEDVVLPMRFGSIADSADEIGRVISENEDALKGELQRLSGKIEMGLRVNWTVPNIFGYMLQVHPELREMRDSLFQGGKKPAQPEMIELGREFDRIENEDREKHTATVEQLMKPHCVEVRRSPVHNEKEVMNLAFLVEKSRRDEYESAVREAADRFDDNFSFEYSGPWAPSTFVETNLQG
jgi:hypothetical protein